MTWQVTVTWQALDAGPHFHPGNHACLKYGPAEYAQNNPKCPSTHFELSSLQVSVNHQVSDILFDMFLPGPGRRCKGEGRDWQTISVT